MNKKNTNYEFADAQAKRWSSPDSVSSSSVLDNMYYTSMKYKRGQAAEANQLVDESGPSNSDVFLSHTRSRELSKGSMEKLSQTRQEYMRELNERSVEGSGRPNLGLVNRIGGFQKTATAATNMGSTRVGSASNTTQVAPDFHSPFYLNQNLHLPTTRNMANAWNRAYYDTNPYVRNAINLHATYPISKFTIKCEDKEIEKFFIEMAERMDLQTAIQNTASEFWSLGEAFPYASFDESTGMWDQIHIHNPDFITVKSSSISKVTSIYLRPDPEIQKVVTSGEPEYVKIRESLDPKIINHVLRNENIPLDDFHISHLKNLSRPYQVRGTSIIMSVWKDLVLLDKLTECKYAQADGMVNPITLVKVGTDGPEGLYPRAEEIEAWRSILEQAQFDKDFKIVTHNAVDIQRLGFSGQIVDTSADFTRLIDNILMGLMVPKSILTQEGATYASASVALDVMRQRYNSFRTMMSNWIEKKLFAPISELQNFYKLEGAVKKLVVPQVEWNHMTLYDLDNYIAHITQLVDKNKVSMRTLDRSLGLNRGNEMANIRQEMIEAAIVEKEKEALSQLTLAELRALDPEEPIVLQEKAKSMLPGQSGPGESGAPGGDILGNLGGPPPGGDLLGGGLSGGAGPMPGVDLGPTPGGETPPTSPVQ